MGGKHKLRRCLKCKKEVANWTKHLKDRHPDEPEVPWEYVFSSKKKVAHF